MDELKMVTKARNSSVWNSGLAWRVGLTAVLLCGGVFTTVRSASGAFEGASLPIANLSGQNAMVMGTARLMGNHFLLYNGTRIASMNDSMAVNFERGGSLTMCPRSEMQLLTATGGAGIMLAFESGGAQTPFPLRMGDEIMTPDWRVELASEARTGEMGLVQVVTNKHGDLCLRGESQSGAYFRVTPLAGDGDFKVTGGQSARFSDGKMETSTQQCGCDASLQAKVDPPMVVGDNAPLVQDAISPVAAHSTPGQAAAETQAGSAMAGLPSGEVKKKARQHPSDVAGYVGSFVHKLFGR